jgi:hypothetical protein
MQGSQISGILTGPLCKTFELYFSPIIYQMINTGRNGFTRMYTNDLFSLESDWKLYIRGTFSAKTDTALVYNVID